MGFSSIFMYFFMFIAILTVFGSVFVIYHNYITTTSNSIDEQYQILQEKYQNGINASFAVSQNASGSKIVSVFVRNSGKNPLNYSLLNLFIDGILLPRQESSRIISIASFSDAKNPWLWEPNEALNITILTPIGNGLHNINIYTEGGINSSIGVNSTISSMVCDTDNITSHYGNHFDQVLSFTDKSLDDISGNNCANYSMWQETLTINPDSGSHNISATNETMKANDSVLNDFNRNYEFSCQSNEKMLVPYLHLKEYQNAQYNLLSQVVIYFTTVQAPPADSYWRIYAYNKSSDGVSSANFIDLPYNPIATNCKASTYLQEIDLSILSEKLRDLSTQNLDYRIGLFPNATGAFSVNYILKIQEIELVAGNYK